MDALTRLEEICQIIGQHLEALARRRCSGSISEAQFVEDLLAIESAEVTAWGFTLTASNTADDWTVFKLHITDGRDVCAAFEFLPETGEFRRPGSGPR